MNARWWICGLSLALAACGGGGNSAESVVDPTSGEWAQICSVDNALAGDALRPTRVGTLSDERQWIKAYLHERYLWYKDMPVVDAQAARYNLTDQNPQLNFSGSVLNYFKDLLNPRYTESGKKVDQFSFMTSTDSWTRFAEGDELGYGWLLNEQGTGSSRRIWVTYVYPTTEQGLAAQAGLRRGDEIVRVDGFDVSDAGNKARVDRVLAPYTSTAYPFVIRRNGELMPFTLTARDVTLPEAEHKLVTDSQGVKWGYLLFNSHVRSADGPLRAALSAFKTQPIDQLVLDLRYNGGGYLALASALAQAVAGASRTQGKTFERVRYNDKRSSEDESMPFYRLGLSGQAFTTLNLSKIYVLTSDQTCSASESIINGLRGVDVQVVQIGGPTCGKPYGFVPQDNCGMTYAAMEFEGVNHKGEGGFADGLQPQCAVTEDLSQTLGDPGEALFAAAIAQHHGEACASTMASRALASSAIRGMGVGPMKHIRPDWTQTKILR